jgi:hypothetical protein
VRLRNGKDEEREMTDLMKVFAEQFGLLPLYAVIIAFGAFNAAHFRSLITILTIFCGLYITMFKAFNLGAQFGPANVGRYLPVSQDVGNMISAVIFVYAIGFAAYGAKRLFVAQDA